MPAHNLRLFLLRPAAGTIHHLHSSEFRIPGLSGSLSAARDPVGAPVLLAAMNCAGTSMVLRRRWYSWRRRQGR